VKTVRLMLDCDSFVSEANPLPVKGMSLPVAIPGKTSATVRKDASTAVEMIADNPKALGRKLYNPRLSGLLCVKYGAAPSGESDASFTVLPGQTWEMPTINGVVEYSGPVHGLLVDFNGATGQFVNVTEVLP